MNNPVGRLLESLFGFGKAWWVKISTESPNCVYYFGPFDSETEAIAAKAGYVEDLEQEGALQIRVTVQRCSRPDRLTIDNEPEDAIGGFSPAFSTQS